MKKPKSWNDITIDQYSDLVKLSEIENKEEREIEYLCVLLDTTPDELKKIPAIEMNEIIRDLKFSETQPKSHFRRVIEIEGQKFGFVTDLELLTLGEWVDLDSYAMDFESSRHKLASLLWRPIVSENLAGYIIEDYDSTKCKQWSEFLKTRMSIQDLWGGSVFFSLIVTELFRYSKGSLIQE